MTDRDETISSGTDSPRSPINFPVPDTRGDDSDDADAGGGVVAGDALLPTTIPEGLGDPDGEAGGGAAPNDRR